MAIEPVDCRRPRVSSSCKDELAVVKAAAWAWFQHGSASESRPAREFDLSRRLCQHRPSRYKLVAEAADIVAAVAADSDSAGSDDRLSSSASSVPLSPASELSLLDPYEVDRISKQLDLLIASSPRRRRRRRRGARVDDRRRRSPPTSVKSAAKAGGLWLRHAVGLCGSTPADVAPEARVLTRIRSQPMLP